MRLWGFPLPGSFIPQFFTHLRYKKSERYPNQTEKTKKYWRWFNATFVIPNRDSTAREAGRSSWGGPVTNKHLGFIMYSCNHANTWTGATKGEIELLFDESFSTLSHQAQQFSGKNRCRSRLQFQASALEFRALGCHPVRHLDFQLLHCAILS